ncbi:AAA family ATPase [Actinoplanes sp. LDG1-06]|uniref:Nuclease SbcCD subunit C n=1 Tax=Paractinoplanes ovalisporus TaxID=2810368 RepID=A0ABS2AP75_9ACTN|nr:AAA family ATPase [Actinoplanes ovalisporus]MBM2621051.1 AAA family ATPase [Actinoplanes ovalisporus]
MSTEHALLEHLFDRLADQHTPDRVAETVLGAFAGEEQLRAVLDGAPADLPEREDTTAEQRHVYLERITVAGFRGIGPAAMLHLPARPGLTLVIGRNGSGKSSFAEAVELALTGDSKRWADHNRIFREGWRNLHHPSPAAIEVTARFDGDPDPVRLKRRWRDEDTEPGQAVAEVRHGNRQYADVDELGWRQPLEAYRPLLSANDLGRLISSRPSDLFDALAPLLAIEPVTEAEARLKRIKRELDAHVKAVSDRRKALRPILGGIDDDRARKAARLFASTRPDLEALDALLADTDDADPQVAAYRRIADLAAMPSPAEITAVADGLIEAARLARETPAGGAAETLIRLLETATEHYDRHGGGACPLCLSGELDADWRARAAEHLERVHDDAQARREAAQALTAARRAVSSLRIDRPVLPDGFPAAVGEQLRVAREAWDAVTSDADPDALAGHLISTYPALSGALTAVRETALAFLQSRHDQWRASAAELQQWLAQAREARVHEEPLTRVKEAIDWYRPVIENLRAEQLAPFAEQSQRIWQELRQESNVELAGMKLDGSSTRRRVAFPATVDGTATSAMSVMSQGEMQALGLAVFLPRAGAEASPFRFLVIDDPVQSMDPAKVDGLARVLASLSGTRQVVVFTHDDRLAEAVRRLEIDATIWEVTRRENSTVDIRKNTDPVDRYLSDAKALAKTDDMPIEVRTPVVLTCCRSALEARCHQIVRARRIGRGEKHRDVDTALAGARTTMQVAALALFDDADAGGKVFARLNSAHGPWAADAVRACKEGAHGHYRSDPSELVADISRLVARLK